MFFIFTRTQNLKQSTFFPFSFHIRCHTINPPWLHGQQIIDSSICSKLRPFFSNGKQIICHYNPRTRHCSQCQSNYITIFSCSNTINCVQLIAVSWQVFHLMGGMSSLHFPIFRFQSFTMKLAFTLQVQNSNSRLSTVTFFQIVV